MCSVEDEGEKEAQRTSRSRFTGAECVKCGKPGVLITRIHDSFCKSCFQVYVIHKFRSAIGKSKLIRDGDKVLVAFSGGANSAALLHLINDGLSERAHKKLRFTPTILYVDECSILSVSSEEKKTITEKVTRLMLSYGYSCYITSLEMGLTINDHGTQNSRTDERFDICEPLNVGDSAEISRKMNQRSEVLSKRLASLINGLASISCKEDFIRNLRNQLIVHIARNMGFSKVLTAECSTRLSVRILTDVSQGRGSQVSLNTGFADQRNGDILFLRPVRDLNAKELSLYNALFDVESVFIPSLTTKGGIDSSIESLTETFITGLQANYSSTVSNIVRTSEKLSVPDIVNSPKCHFCQSPLDTDVGDASALKAIECSQRLSQMGCLATERKDGETCSQPGNQVAGECCGEGDGSCQSKNQISLTEKELYEFLCFGCRLSLRNFGNSLTALPGFVVQPVMDKKKRDMMKQEISDFLLDDDADDDHS